MIPERILPEIPQEIHQRFLEDFIQGLLKEFHFIQGLPGILSRVYPGIPSGIPPAMIVFVKI